MAQVEHAPEPLDAVSAELETYLAHADQTPVAASSVVDGRIEYREGDFVRREVTIHNGRLSAEPFSTYDSDRESRSRFTAHASFDDPTSVPGAPGRVSIEVRAFAFFNPD